jgi:hypothetical protein
MELNPGIDPRNLQIGQVITIRPGFQYYPSYNNGMMDDEMFFNGNMMNGMPFNGNMMNGMPYNGNMMNGMPPNRNMMDGTPFNGNMMNGMPPNGNMMDGMPFNGNMMNGMPPNGNMMNNNMMNGTMAELRSYMHMLWDQHVTWTFMTVLAILNDLSQTEIITQRLLRNATDFGEAFLPYYGEEDAQRLTDLMTAHITIAAELVQAAKNQDTNLYRQIEERWYNNAMQIASFLSDINPNWNVEDWSAMLEEHLELLASAVADMVAQNYENAINSYDDIQLQALEMADMMVEGIMEQFPSM